MLKNCFGGEVRKRNLNAMRVSGMKPEAKWHTAGTTKQRFRIYQPQSTATATLHKNSDRRQERREASYSLGFYKRGLLGIHTRGSTAGEVGSFWIETLEFQPQGSIGVKLFLVAYIRGYGSAVATTEARHVVAISPTKEFTRHEFFTCKRRGPTLYRLYEDLNSDGRRKRDSEVHMIRHTVQSQHLTLQVRTDAGHVSKQRTFDGRRNQRLSAVRSPHKMQEDL